jgi:hypothetical protein
VTLRELLREVLGGGLDDEVMLLTPAGELVDVESIVCTPNDALVLLRAEVVE